jgi:hypothetical protein
MGAYLPFKTLLYKSIMRCVERVIFGNLYEPEHPFLETLRRANGHGKLIYD